MNSFEAEVFDVLSAKDIPLIPQLGASSYRIDLVAQHPKQPGSMFWQSNVTALRTTLVPPPGIEIVCDSSSSRILGEVSPNMVH